MGIRVADGVVSAWYYNGTSWAELSSVVDATYTGSGQLGLWLEGITTQVDNFSGGLVTTSISSQVKFKGMWKGMHRNEQ